MYQYFIKRFLDIIISIVLIPFAIVICIPFALLIKINDRGPIFYNADRLGKNMKQFKMYKLRTMIVDAPDIRNEDGSTFNSSEDPRVTKIGNILRKTSVDELPQLFNVLLGNMSFVGPRPSPLGNEKNYSKEFKKKFLVKPGITGLNQATLRNTASMEERIENDLLYVNEISFSMDIKIIIMTFINVIKKKNINQDEYNEKR